MAEKKIGLKKIKSSKIKLAKIQLLTANWLLQRNRHIKIELSVILTVFGLFHVHVWRKLMANIQN